MKKAAAFLVAIATAACVFTGCEPKKKDIKNQKVTQQNSSSYEDAIRECFDAMNSSGGGKVFYSYMYPNVAIDAMNQSGEYDSLIQTFNQTQERRLNQSTQKYSYDKIKEANPLSEQQISGSKSYFVELCQPFVADIKEDAFDIKEGYEVTFSYLDNNGASEDETVIVLSLNDEGWKVITH